MQSSTVLERVESFCRRLLLRRASLLVAVSGGSDSTALLHIMHGLRERLEIARLGVLHVNHGLRGAESDGDEEFVAAMAQRLGLAVFTKRLSGRSLDDRGVEAWARRERYEFFRHVKLREGFDRIATGHTADDQAETLLLRLWRGAGLRGLRGILPERFDGVVRPLLPLWKREIVEWLGERTISFRNDQSNLDTSFRRNWIRREVLPELERREPGAGERLVAIARLVGEFWQVAEPGVERWIGHYVEKEGGGFRINKEGLGDEFHACEGLRSQFETYGIPHDAHHIDGVLANAVRGRGRFLLRGGWQYYPERGSILFCKEPPAASGEFRFELRVPGVTECPLQRVRVVVEQTEAGLLETIPRDNRTVALDREACGDVLVYRSWRREDEFEPLGSSHAIRVGEFLAKQKFSKEGRARCGVVEGKNGAIVWIPEVRIGNGCRITPATHAVLKISYISFPEIV